MNEQNTPAGKLSEIAKELRCYHPPSDPYNGEYIHKGWADRIDAIIAADRALRALRASPAAGDVAMSVAGWHTATNGIWKATGIPVVAKIWREQGCTVEELVKQSDAQAALAAKDDELSEMRAEILYRLNQGNAQSARIAALTAERDALLVAAKYAEHIDATPENQLQTMLYDTLTERDTLKANETVLRQLVAEGVTLRNQYIDEITTLTAERDELRKSAEWRPIFSAPKDGTWVDLHVSSSVFPGVSRRESMCRWSVAGWQHYNNGGYGYVSGDATHWMPIPAQPLILDTANVAATELDALRKDAERYRWLHLQDLTHLSLGYIVDAPHDGEFCVDTLNGTFYGKTLGAAIDAAMTRGPK